MGKPSHDRALPPTTAEVLTFSGRLLPFCLNFPYATMSFHAHILSPQTESFQRAGILTQASFIPGSIWYPELLPHTVEWMMA